MISLAIPARRRLQQTGLKSISSVAISPDGNHIAAGGVNGLVLWDSHTGAVCGTFPHSGQVKFTSDGLTLINLRANYESLDGSLALGNSVDYLDARTARRRLRAVFAGYGILSIAVDPQGQILAGRSAGAVGLYDLATGDDVGTLSGDGEVISVLAYSHDGARVALAGGPGITVWDLRTARTVRLLPTGTKNGTRPDVSSLFFSPRDDVVYAALSDGVRSWRVADGQPQETLCKVSTATRRSPDYYSTYYSQAALGPDGARLFGLRTLSRSEETTGHWLDCAKIDVWDRASGRKQATFGDPEWAVRPSVDADSHPFTQAAVSRDGQHLATARLGRPAVQIWATSSGHVLRTIDTGTEDVLSLAYSPAQDLLAVGSGDGIIRLWADGGGRQVGVLRGDAAGGGMGPLVQGIAALAFTPDGSSIVSGGNDRSLTLWRVSDLSRVRTLGVMDGPVWSIGLSPDGSQCAVTDGAGTVRFYRLPEGTLAATLVVATSGEVLAASPEGYFTSPRPALRAVAFRLGDRAYPFEQFDLRLNRPDKVLEALGCPDQGLIGAYHAAYEKRLQTMEFTAAQLGDDFQLPSCVLTARPPQTTPGRTLTFSARASDSQYPLDRLQVFVNDVPANFSCGGALASGSAGLSLRGHNIKTFLGTITVPLSAGVDKVQISVLNTAGVESLRQTFNVACTARAGKSDLYVIAVGVSQYPSASRLPRLSSADADAQAIADFFGSHAGAYAHPPHILLLLNGDATRENILKTHEVLMRSGLDDEVVVFLAGHGLLDGDNGYYFATSNVDALDPARFGLAYNEIEGLLDGLPAQHKLLLMDTCHAGELGRPTVTVTNSSPNSGLKPGTRGSRLVSAQEGLEDAFDLQEDLFADLRRGSGATVVAAARGKETAGETHDHGLFTQAVLAALSASPHQTVSQLQQSVAAQITRQTQGRQRPVARRENLTDDFPVVPLPRQ